MQEGIRHVREGRMADAYRVFKQVIERDPRNEFAQIWISVTSEDRAEKRAALEKALEINPNSQHAKEALRSLNAEQSRLPPKPDQVSQNTVPLRTISPAQAAEPTGQTPRVGVRETPSQPGRIGTQDFVSNPFQDMPSELATNSTHYGEDDQETNPYTLGQLGQTAPQTNPPRLGTREINTTPRLEEKPSPASLVSMPATKDKKSGKQKLPADTITAADQAANTPEKRERLFLRRIRLTGFFILAIVLVLLAAFLVFNLLQSQSTQQQQANQTTPTDQITATTASTVVASPAANALQTSPAAALPTSIQLSPTASNNTTANATTSPATTSPQAAPTSGTQAAIAKNLQTARDSQASGDYKSAITAYRAVLESDTNNVPANLGLGTLYLSAPATALSNAANRYAEAAQAFRVVTAQNPNWAGGYSHLGEALALQGTVKDAISAYSRSLELDPNGPERWLALAALYEKDNQPEQARYCRERAGSIAPAPPTPSPAPTATPAPTTVPPGATTPK